MTRTQMVKAALERAKAEAKPTPQAPKSPTAPTKPVRAAAEPTPAGKPTVPMQQAGQSRRAARAVGSTARRREAAQTPRQEDEQVEGPRPVAARLVLQREVRRRPDALAESLERPWQWNLRGLCNRSVRAPGTAGQLLPQDLEARGRQRAG
jgi:hypothetical protein